MRAARRSRPAPLASRASRLSLRGRHWIALWLLGFLAMALIVIRRQQDALETTRELQQLQKARGALEVSKAELIGGIHQARSRAVLVPLAQQKLGLRLPQDSEITILQDPRPR